MKWFGWKRTSSWAGFVSSLEETSSASASTFWMFGEKEMKLQACVRKLPELIATVKKLEEELAKLREERDAKQ